VLDWGCGRGFLLETLRGEGFDRLAGADPSPLARALLRQAGFEAVAPGASLPGEGLSFRPEVLALLDVLEHLDPPSIRETLAELVARLGPALRLVVVKVPVSDGLLYRMTRALQVAGAPGPLEQLYQVGTEPPHRSYFSAASAAALLTAAGLELVRATWELDFEPEALAARARALRRFPTWARLAGRAVAALSRALDRADSLILLARPRPPGRVDEAPTSAHATSERHWIAGSSREGRSPDGTC
jgi:hypothetical protein